MSFYNKQLLKMKFQTIEKLIQTLDKNQSYSHEIKGKRLRKQLKSLAQGQFEGIKFKCYQMGDVAISILIDAEVPGKQNQTLRLRLDREYPFNPPQILYEPSSHKSDYSFCKDILGAILKNQIWGPSLTLPLFLQKIPNLAAQLSKKQKIVWTYHNQFQYGKDELTKSGVKLFPIEQYKWEYKILKLKKLKWLGLTPDCILKFQPLLDDQNILKLDFWTQIKNIVQVKATPGKKNYQLQLEYALEEKTQKLYLGGANNDLQVILDSLNPIHMVERKVKNYEKSGVTDYNDAIQSYTTLIQHYSLTNKQLTEKYMSAMKKLIQSHYDNKNKDGADKMVEIQT